MAHHVVYDSNPCRTRIWRRDCGFCPALAVGKYPAGALSRSNHTLWREVGSATRLTPRWAIIVDWPEVEPLSSLFIFSMMWSKLPNMHIPWRSSRRTSPSRNGSLPLANSHLVSYLTLRSQNDRALAILGPSSHFQRVFQQLEEQDSAVSSCYEGQFS